MCVNTKAKVHEIIGGRLSSSSASFGSMFIPPNVLLLTESHRFFDSNCELLLQRL